MCPLLDEPDDARAKRGDGGGDDMASGRAYSERKTIEGSGRSLKESVPDSRSCRTPDVASYGRYRNTSASPRFRSHKLSP